MKSNANTANSHEGATAPVHMNIKRLSGETVMAPSRNSNVKRGDTGENSQISYKKAINAKSDRVLQNRKHANDIFDVIEYLQVCVYFTILEVLSNTVGFCNVK